MKYLLTILILASSVFGAQTANVTFDPRTGNVNQSTLNFTSLDATTLTITNVSGTVPDANIAATIARDSEVASSQTGTHASPDTTNPLSPTWTGLVHTVWYGATGTINLPAAASYAGKGILIYNTGAFTVTVDANASEVIVRDGTAQTGGVSMTLSSGAGNYVALISDGVRWVTVGYKGTLAAGS